jgi:hypothetical protein
MYDVWTGIIGYLGSDRVRAEYAKKWRALRVPFLAGPEPHFITDGIDESREITQINTSKVVFLEWSSTLLRVWFRRFTVKG